MAIISTSPLVGQIRGSVGGVTFSNSVGGNVAKKKPNPRRRLRPPLFRNRSVIGFLSREWGELTDAQRVSWRTWAQNHPGVNAVGDSFIMSGINAYTKLNSVALRLGGIGSDQVLPPEDPAAATLATLAVTTGAIGAGDIDLVWTVNGTGAADDYVEIGIAGPFQSAGRVEVESMRTYKQDVAGNIALDTVEDLDEGFWYWVFARYVDQYGQTTAWLAGQATPKLTI